MNCEKCIINGEIDGYRTDIGGHTLDLDHLARNGVTIDELARIAQVGDEVVKDGKVIGEVSQICEDGLIELYTVVYGVYVTVEGAVDSDERYPTIEEAQTIFDDEKKELRKLVNDGQITQFSVDLEEVTEVGQITDYGEEFGIEWYPDETRDNLDHTEWNDEEEA